MEKNTDWWAGYETGYKDGENNMFADWKIALNEAFDLECDSIAEVIEKIRERLP